MFWNAVTALASVVSTLAIIATALYVRSELKALEKDRFLNLTNELFSVWQSKEFMEAQLWLIHRLEEGTWEEFVQVHRADVGEAAFHRVGSFYDRVGTLVRLGFVDEREILSTIGAYAIAVWQKVEPLVREARRIENSVLFDDFERLLPACYECYVPALGQTPQVRPFSLDQSGHPTEETGRRGDRGDGETGRRGDGETDETGPGTREAGGGDGTFLPGRPVAPSPQVPPSPRRLGPPVAEPDRISVQELKRRLDRREPLTVLDVRQPASLEKDPRTLPGALPMLPAEVPDRFRELPSDREVIVYCA